MPNILQDLPPDSLRLARDDRVHALQGFIETHRGVNAAHDDRHAQAPEMSGHFVGAAGLGGERRDAHEVRPRHRLVVRDAKVLVHDLVSHSGGVRPAMVIRLSGFHTRYRFQRLSLTWTMLTSGLDGLMSKKRMACFRIKARLLTPILTSVLSSCRKPRTTVVHR